MPSSVEFRPWRSFDPDDPRSLVGEIRRRRWTRLALRFPDLAEMSVLDLGGTPDAWLACSVQPARLVTLNTEPSGRNDSVHATVVTGDACDPPTRLRNERFDLVYSNSVFEHVGGHDRRKRFAATVDTSAPHYWIQTPYRYFPIEPHILFPGYQFLPLIVRASISRRWGPARRSVRSMSNREAIDFVQSIELLTVTDMKAYFPDAQIERERLGGIVKSLIAIR